MSTAKKALVGTLAGLALLLGANSLLKHKSYKYEAGTCYILQLVDKEGKKHPSALMIAEVEGDTTRAMLFPDMMPFPQGIEMPSAELKKQADSMSPQQVNCETGEPLK